MRFPDPKELMSSLRINDRVLSAMNVSQMQERLDVIEEKTEALQHAKDQLDNPAYLWLKKEYLPNEKRRIQNERDHIASTDAYYEKRHLVIDGQIAEIDRIINQVNNIDYEIKMLRKQIRETKQAIVKRSKQQATVKG